LALSGACATCRIGERDGEPTFERLVDGPLIDVSYKMRLGVRIGD
jgi:hypothetical protein